MRFSAIQPYIALVASLISAFVTILIFFLTRAANQKVENLKSSLQIEVVKATEPFKASLSKEIENFKSNLQIGVIKETEPFKASLNEEIEGLKSSLQIDIARETEPLKAALSRDNIAFQIHSAEYLKMRFQKINELFTSILTLHDYLKRSKLLADNDGAGSGSEGYPKKFEEKRLACEQKIDNIYSKSYDATLYFDKPIRSKIEKYILSARRVILYSQFYVMWNNTHNFKMNDPSYVFHMQLPEEDAEKRKASRFEEVINGKKYILEPEKQFANSEEYRIEVQKRLDRESKELETNFDELESLFKEQLMSKVFCNCLGSPLEAASENAG